MKRLIAVLLVLTMSLTPALFKGAGIKASAATVKTEIGNVYFSRVNGLYDDGNTNQTFLIPPGSSCNGAYYDRLYATYDSSVGGYVVKEKVATHCSFSRTIGTNEIGIALSNQAADSNKGADFARKNYLVWQQIRVGDILKLHNVDLTNKKITTSGTWGTTSFTSSSYVSVTTVRDSSTPKTSYSNKKIVVLGDSVTAGGGMVEALNIEFNCNMINVATPGDRTDEGLKRFDTLVAPHNPDIVMIKFAINDCVQYTVTSNTLPTFKSNLKKLYDKCAALGATVVFMTTNNINISSLNYDRYANFGGLGNYFPQYQQAIRDVASETGSFCIDIYKGWQGVTATNYLMDTVHPNASGYAIDISVAKTYLRNNMEAIAGKLGVSAPSVTVSQYADYGSAISASWNGVEDATSYKYEATLYMGEKDITDSSVVYSGTTTATSITIPAQTKGKYLDVKITAVGADSENSATKTVMLAPSNAYPDNIQYIPVADINGTIISSNSTVWTSSHTATFNATYWAVAICTPNKDGTYTVKEKYESGQTKSLKATGNDLLLATYGGYDNFKYAAALKVGDKVEFCGLYLSMDNTISPKAYVKVNGGIPLHPTDLTLKDTSVKFKDGMLTGVSTGVGIANVKAMFNEDAAYITVKDANGNAVTDGVAGTGFTVNLVAEGKTLKTYTVVVLGDVNSDGSVSATDYITLKGALNNTVSLAGAFKEAGDYDASGEISSADYIAIKRAIASA